MLLILHNITKHNCPFPNPNSSVFSPRRAYIQHLFFCQYSLLSVLFGKRKFVRKQSVTLHHCSFLYMNCLSPEGTPKLIPEEGSMYYHRVQHYRELLDSLQMDAYTHGCILHPEITVDSHIPAYAATSIRSKRCTPVVVYIHILSRHI